MILGDPIHCNISYYKIICCLIWTQDKVHLSSLHMPWVYDKKSGGKIIMNQNNDFKLMFNLLEWELEDRIKSITSKLESANNRSLRVRKNTYEEVLKMVRNTHKGAVYLIHNFIRFILVFAN